MKGKFIVLEGIDGCGKTTQINHLAKWLPQSGLMPEKANLKITREPGGTELGIALRDLLLNPPGSKTPEPLTELLLYAADRAQHISQIIKPTLENGDWILSDRFSGSTITYQGFGRGLDMEIIKQLEKIATQHIQPDLTFWLSISVKESLFRRKSTSNDRMESEGQDFLDKVNTGFAHLSNKRNWIKIEADGEQFSVNKKIETAIKNHLKSNKQITHE